MKRKAMRITFLFLSILIIAFAVTIIGCDTYKTKDSISIDGKDYPLLKLPKGHVFQSAYEKDGLHILTRGPGDLKGPCQFFLFRLSSETGKAELKPVIVFEEQ